MKLKLQNYKSQKIVYEIKLYYAKPLKACFSGRWIKKILTTVSEEQWAISASKDNSCRLDQIYVNC